MEIDVLKHISSVTHTLPKNQQLVANYFMSNWNTTLYESSMMIAKQVGVSQSTVVRTVKKLGYKGFPEFQSELRRLLQHQFSSTKRIDQVSMEQEGQTIEQRIARVFYQHQKNLKNTLCQIDAEQMQKVAKLIWQKKRVFVLGLRTSGVLAHYFGIHLSMIRENVIILSSDYTLLEHIRTVTEDDVLVVFSFTRYCRDAIEAAYSAHDQKCTIVGVTDNIAAPLTSIADIVFHVPVISMHYSNSYVAVFALIDVLLNTIGITNKPATMKALQSMEEGFERFHTFY
jgi:DNA-binding MurR/RpiR family transcriptional regulator